MPDASLSPPSSRSRSGLAVVGYAALYAVAAFVGLRLAIPPGNVTAVFPASGVGLAAALLRPRAGLIGVGLGSFLVNGWLTPTAHGVEKLLLGALIAAGAMLQAWLGAQALRRWMSEEREIRSAQDAFVLVGLGGLAACMVNASVSALSLRALGLLETDRASYVWLTWWLGDATGVMVVTPLFLAHREPAQPVRSTTEVLTLAAVTLAASLGALSSPYPIFYLLLPPLIWAAYRFGQRGAALLVSVLSLLCVLAAVQRAGFTTLYSLERGLLTLQGFLGVAALSGLSLGALASEQARTALALRQVNEALDARVSLRTRELEEANQQLIEQKQQLHSYTETLDARLRSSISERSEQLIASLNRLLAKPPAFAGPTPGAVFGPVRVGRRLGSGGMADVFEATDLISDQPVALKVLRGRHDPERQRSLALEARATTAIDHPTIVRTLQIDATSDGRLYLLLEHITGETLAVVLRRFGALPLGAAARLGAQIAEGLAAAHAAGVLHRDIKPSNLMLTVGPPGLKILDFGIAQLTLEAPSAHPHLAGSPPYMSPEQIQSLQRLTPATDLYSLGVVLFECCTGRRPIEARSTASLLLAHLIAPPTPLRLLRPEAPPELAALLEELLAKDPSLRPDAPTTARKLHTIADSLSAPSLEQLARQGIEAAQADTSTLPSLVGETPTSEPIPEGLREPPLGEGSTF